MKRKEVIELAVIVLISIAASLIFNRLTDNPLPLFKSYKPPAKALEPSEREIDSIEKIDMDIFKYFMAKKNTIILDARGEEEFRIGHIPGAFSFPVSKFETFFKERGAFLMTGKTIITYCSGKDCKDSAILALKLKQKGVKDVLLFSGGISEWIEKENETEASDR